MSNSFVTPWTVAYQAPPSMGFPRQKYWSGLPFHSPGDLPYPGIELWSPALQADSLLSQSKDQKKEVISLYPCQEKENGNRYRQFKEETVQMINKQMNSLIIRQVG